MTKSHPSNLCPRTAESSDLAKLSRWDVKKRQLAGQFVFVAALPFCYRLQRRGSSAESSQGNKRLLFRIVIVKAVLRAGAYSVAAGVDGTGYKAKAAPLA
jgi:hypothetical protein